MDDAGVRDYCEGWLRKGCRDAILERENGSVFAGIFSNISGFPILLELQMLN